MTEQKAPEMTDEQKQASFDRMQYMHMNTINGNAKVLGADYLNSLGKEGSTIAKAYLQGADLKETRENLQNEFELKAKNLGINTKRQVQDYDTIEHTMQINNASYNYLTMGNIEKMAKAYMPEMETGLTDSMRSKMGIELSEAMKGIKNLEDMSPDNQYLYKTYESMINAQKKGAGMEMLRQSGIEETNQEFKKAQEFHKFMTDMPKIPAAPETQ
ncbi:MAG: hypothetical protein PF542_04275 [Nanoarchaeota archaeon]|jgi:hypothetical protein|nr:hypothetical protein [Nanoarchaeota archaeon]